MEFARGNFIDNQWVKPAGPGVIRSINPATAGEVVLEAPTSAAHAAEAVAAAARAWPAWAALPQEDRVAALRRFARELTSRTEALARAITQEMGKTIREARQETTGLVQRVDMVIDQQLPQVKAWSPANIAGECRYHPLGVIGVLGPFNFPLHLCHAHIIPALATGNTVVVKPSERTPLAFQRYMEAWAAANLPPILHMVQGGADVGRALLAADELRGIAFTGSWRVGHQITKSLVDRPEVLAALEMGGQNMCIVLADADLDQALEGVLLGGYLSAGQRCTCTARVLVQRTIADAFIARLVKAAKNLTFGDPMSDVFMGPMASVGDRDRVEALCRAGREAGAEVLMPAELRDGGAWRGPSVHVIPPDHDSDYTREEVFGPDLAVTIVNDLDHAIEVVKRSPYGLSVGLFSARRQAFEQVYLHTRVGCVSWNRSTNRTLGALPFGGVGKSGNYRPAGSDAVRYTTYPVQVLWNEPGVMENDPYVRQATSAADPLMALEARHRIEEALEPYGLTPDIDPSGKSGFVKIPLGQLDSPQISLSRALVEQLQKRQVTAEIAEQAVRVPLSAGAEAPKALARSLADALYAIRPLYAARFLSPAGNSSTQPTLEALVQGRFGTTPLDGGNAERAPASATAAARLRELSGDHLRFVRHASSAAEALELALAVAQARRPGRRTIVATDDVMPAIDRPWWQEYVFAWGGTALGDEVAALVTTADTLAAEPELRSEAERATVPLVVIGLAVLGAGDHSLAPDLVASAASDKFAVTLSRWPIPCRPEVAPATVVRTAIALDAPVEAAPEEAADPLPPARLATPTSGSYKLTRITQSEWPTIRPAYEALEHTADLARPDFETFTALVNEPDTLGFAVMWHGPQKPPGPGPIGAQQPPPKPGTLVGVCFGFALEHAAALPGPAADPNLGRGDTFYSADLVVHKDHADEGLARALKEAQIAAAIHARRPDGSPRFAFMTSSDGPNASDALAASYGAWEVRPGYQRLALTWPRLPPAATVLPLASDRGLPTIDLETGLERRLGHPQGHRPGNEELREHLAEGRLNRALVDARSVVPQSDRAVRRALEWLVLQAPKGMAHLLLATGRAEAMDFTLAAMAEHQRGRQRGRGVVLSLGPVRAGLATAAARAVSLPGADEGNWFGWPTLADPTRDPDKALLDIKKAVAELGANQVGAIVLEPVYLATGRVVPEPFWGALRAVADENDVPVVLVENATAGFRNGKSFWRADTLPAPVDAIVWYPGGGLGLGFVRARQGPAERLPDLDELSLTRLVWELRVARGLPIATRAAELRRALAPLGEGSGEGLFVTVEHPAAESIQRRLAERGVRVGLEERLLRFAPPLNITADDIVRLAAIIREVTN